MKLNYKELLDYQTYWEENEHISLTHKNGLIELSDKLMQRLKENNDEIDDVKLLYPEDCSDFHAFADFALLMQAYVSVKDTGGFQMSGWFLNNQIEVE